MRHVILSVMAFCVGCTYDQGPAMLTGDVQSADTSRIDLATELLDGVRDVPEVGRGCDGSYRTCTGNHLLLCVESVWTVVEPPCAFGCAPGGWCNTCRPAAVQCQDQGIAVCNESGAAWEVRETCAPPCTSCQDGACVTIGTCAGKVCGNDGCGNDCGWCVEGRNCVDGQCAP